mgnify:CR=1 FL=1
MKLPIIDMSGLRSEVADEREAVGRALKEACLDKGFFYLTGHQVSTHSRHTAMTAVRDLGIHEQTFILVGVGPLRSAAAAEWIRTNIPGVVIPDPIIQRLKSVPAGNQREEGRNICVEIIQQVSEIPGVSGVHVMAYRQEELVAEIIAESGLQ